MTDMPTHTPVPSAGQRIGGRDTHLFRPVTFRSVTAKNRIMVSPMCQYSAVDGVANAWHMQHLGSLAAGGSGIVCVEATHVEPRGRITPGCAGLWTDAQRDAIAPIAAFIASLGAVPAVQLAHAGRKGSSGRPWEDRRPIPPEAGGWSNVAPSALPFEAEHPIPAEMSVDDIGNVLAAFAASARRSVAAGFQIAEIHGAHGYLIHSFLSPLSNKRTDRYGGSLHNRARFLLECVAAVRSEWPAELPLFVRLSCSDWVEGGFSIDDAVTVSAMLKATGEVDLIDCSSGGNDPRQAIPLYPGYQVPFAARIRAEAGIPTGAVGLIRAPDHAEAILGEGSADLILLARALLADKHWPLRAAEALRTQVAWTNQYARGSASF